MEKGMDKRQLILDRMHTANCPHYQSLLGRGALWLQWGARTNTWEKTLKVDTIINLCDTLAVSAHRAYQPFCQVNAYGSVMVHERFERSTQQVVFGIGPIQIVHITPMLAMDTS